MNRGGDSWCARNSDLCRARGFRYPVRRLPAVASETEFIVSRSVLPLVLSALGIIALAAPLALAHSTGNEARSPSECDVLPGTALAGARGECLRCINRGHYHYHSELPRRQRCHRENFNPNPTPHPHHGHGH
jgi:hypothetical protein